MRFVCYKFLIRLSIHECIEVAHATAAELKDPAFTKGIIVDEFGGVLELTIYFAYLAANRRVDIGNRLYRFHHAGWFPLLKDIAHIG